MGVFQLRFLFGLFATGIVAWVVFTKPLGLTTNQAYSAALIIGTLALWATAIIPEIMASLLFFLLAMLLALAPARIVFSGFHSTANWTIFGGLVIGAAVQNTGLGERIANTLAKRFTFGYVGIITGMVTVGVVLSFLMPSSMGRIVLLAPIAMALAARLGFEPGSNGYFGVVMAMGWGTSGPAAGILPANVPNLILMGAADSVYDVAFTYGPYLLLHFPALGLFKAVLIVVVTVLLFPDQPKTGDLEVAPTQATPDEKRLGLFLVLALKAWMTDFVHEISPAWIALAVALFCMLPIIGVLPKSIFAGNINFVPIFLTAAILGVAALVNSVGLGEVIVRELHSAVTFDRGEDFETFVSVVLIDTLLQFFITVPGVAAVMVPISGSIAEATGLPVATVLNMHAVGYSNYMLPYQMGPILILGALCNVSNIVLTRMCLVVGLLGLVIGTPLSYLWWSSLGYFG